MSTSAKTILAAVDFSPISTDVVATAAGLARAVGGRLLLRYVIQIPIPVVNFQIAVGEVAALAAGTDGDEAEERLAGLSRDLAGIRVESGCVSGPPSVEICREARDAGADFIVIGSHGHGSLYELLIGTTTQGVLKDAPCPVVIVPAGRVAAAGHRAATAS